MPMLSTDKLCHHNKFDLEDVWHKRWENDDNNLQKEQTDLHI